MDKLTLEQRQDLYKIASETWGQYAQMEMAIEESLEFGLAVRKQIRKSDDTTFTNLVEEFADMEIMLEQVEFLHSDLGFRDMVESQKEFKLNRLKQRLAISTDTLGKEVKGE